MLPPSTANPSTPSPTAHNQLWPVSDQARNARPVVTKAMIGIASPTNSFSAVRSNSGDSSSTAMASMTSSTSGRYRSVRVTDTNVSSAPSTTPASSSDSLAFNGGAPGRANAHTPFALKSKPANTSAGVSSSNSASTATVSSM